MTKYGFCIFLSLKKTSASLTLSQ